MIKSTKSYTCFFIELSQLNIFWTTKYMICNYVQAIWIREMYNSYLYSITNIFVYIVCIVTNVLCSAPTPFFDITAYLFLNIMYSKNVILTIFFNTFLTKTSKFYNKMPCLCFYSDMPSISSFSTSMSFWFMNDQHWFRRSDKQHIGTIFEDSRYCRCVCYYMLKYCYYND